MTQVLHQNINQAFEHELAVMLRRRFLWLCATWIGLTVLGYARRVAPPIYQFFTEGDFSVDLTTLSQLWALVFGELGRLIILGIALNYVYRKCRTRRDILHVASRTMIALGLLIILVQIHPEQPWPARFGFHPSGTFEIARTDITVAAGRIALAHLFMCLFLPWTPAQAIKPIVVLGPIWLTMTLLYEGFSDGLLFSGLVQGLTLTGIGLLICWGRHSQIWEQVESKVLRTQFRETQRELFDARRIHQARFPKPIRQGPIQLEFSYEPMRQIGGDFLHAHTDDDDTLHVALIDVTGHGIAAALAVNRIDGELARLVAEQSAAPPENMLANLNRYIHLTMARHSLYATAFCYSLSTTGILRWANGGHPPAFIRRVDGTVESLDSTAFMLGACPASVFDSDPQQTQLAVGDRLVVYTDGACEACDERGRQFGLQGLRQSIEHWQPNREIDLIPFLPETVRKYRAGAPDDDILFTVTSLTGQTESVAAVG